MNMQKEKRIFLSLALLIVGIFVALAFALPPLPHNFWGTVKDAGGTAIPGATITVRLNGLATDAAITDNLTSITGTTATADGAGNYDLILIMDDPDTPAVEGAKAGDVVHIYINGAECAETKAGTTLVVAGGGATAFNISLPDITGPTTSVVRADGNAPYSIPQGTASVTLTATVSDVGTGGSNIAAAEYFVGTVGAVGTGTAMTLAAGAAAPTKAVSATVATSAWTAASSPYTIYVRGKDSANNWGATQTVVVSVYLAPAAPTITNVPAITGNNEPAMSWAPIAGATYDFQLASDAGFVNIISTLTGTALTSFTPAVPLPDGSYYWRVRAIDAASHAGPWATGTVFAVDTTAPAAVTGLAITPLASGDLKLDWTNPAADFAGVIVLAKTGSAPALATPTNGTTYVVGQNDVVAVGNIATFTDAPLVNGTHRYYKVFAYDSVKNYSPVAAVDGISADTLPPAAVTGFTASPGDTKATLSWTNPADADFAGVIVLYKAATAITGAPTQGTSYNLGDTIGDATVGYKGSLQTAQITGLTNNVLYYFTIYAYDERPNYSAGAAASTTPVPFGITAPAALTVDVKVGQQVALSATGPSGSFKWTTTGGTLSAATGASVTWTAPAAVAASPTPYTITLTDGVNSALTDTRTINVFSGVGIANKPVTVPTILPGQSSTFTVSGGDSTLYTWTVTDRSGAVIGVPQTGASFTFTAPNTGAFAGEYTIAVTDKNGLSTDSFKVKVPFTISPANWNFLSTDLAKTFNVTGGAGTGYTWDIMDSLTATTPVATPADYGTWTGTATTVAATNGFTPNVAMTLMKTFFVRVTVTGDPDLTTANGLDKLTVGPFNVIPMASFTVNVKKADGTALSGALVTVNYAGQSFTTLADGKATFSLPDSGGTYAYNISENGYVSQSISSALKSVNVTLQTVGATIAGTVQDVVPAAIAGATVTAFLPTALATEYTATTAADGTYTINLPTGAATTGWTVVAAKTNYTAVQQTGINAGATGVNFTLAAAGAGAPDVGAGGGTKTMPLTNGQTASVTVAAGGLTVDGFIIINQTAKTSTTSGFTSGSPGYVYEVKATSDAAGTTNLAAANIKRLVITIPLDLSKVKPGDMEKGVYVIYSATSLANLQNGVVTPVPVANIIGTDYIGTGATAGTIGSVTFWVDHLSFFGIGGGSGTSASASGSGGSSSSGCFIATAAYGSYMDKHVELLRNFRDAYLLTNSAGKAFVEFYYRHSPPFADFIAAHDSLRAMVRIGLAPLVGMSYLAMHTTMAQKLILALLLTGGLVMIGMAIRRYTRRVERT